VCVLFGLCTRPTFCRGLNRQPRDGSAGVGSSESIGSLVCVSSVVVCGGVRSLFLQDNDRVALVISQEFQSLWRSE
jgi:hypothetical protein